MNQTLDEKLTIDREWFREHGFMQTHKDEFKTHVTFQDIARTAVKFGYETAMGELMPDLKRADRAISRYLSAVSLFVEKFELKSGDCGTHEHCLNLLRKVEMKLDEALQRLEAVKG